MDDNRFDDLARTLVAGLPRRRLIRALGGGLVGGLLAGWGPRAVGAASDPRCPADKPFVDNKTCDQAAAVCPSTSDTSCGCFLTVAGTRACVVTAFTGGCPKRDECDRNRDCRPGRVCVKVGGCCPKHPERNQCLQKCPA